MLRGEKWFAATQGGDRPVLARTRDPVADRIGTVIVPGLTGARRLLVSELVLASKFTTQSLGTPSSFDERVEAVLLVAGIDPEEVDVLAASSSFGRLLSEGLRAGFLRGEGKVPGAMRRAPDEVLERPTHSDQPSIQLALKWGPIGDVLRRGAEHHE